MNHPPSTFSELIFVIMFCVVIAAFTYSSAPKQDADIEANKDDY